MRTFQKAIDAAAKACEKACDAAITDLRARMVIPYCEIHGCEFTAGMGTWNFRWPDGRMACDRDWTDVRLPKFLARALSTDYPLNPGQSCGSMMQDYSPKGKK